MKKLHISQIVSNLVVTKPLSTTSRMYNFVAKFGKILDICTQFAGNRVNYLGNTTRCGVVPKFSDLEVIALSITAEVHGIDSENLLFKRLEASSVKIPNLISRRQFNTRRKRIETVFSQLGDQFMMTRNYAKQTCGLFTRTAAKIAAMTTLQYVNYVNHRTIGQVKYALI